MKSENLFSIVGVSAVGGAIASELAHTLFPSEVYGVGIVGVYMLLVGAVMLIAFGFGVAIGITKKVIVEVPVQMPCHICGSESGKEPQQQATKRQKPEREGQPKKAGGSIADLMPKENLQEAYLLAKISHGMRPRV